MTALDDAWQRALGAEHQAVFGYALLGAHLDTAADADRARACQDQHATLRDHTAAAIIAAGQTPDPPHADYPALYPVRDAPAARSLAVRLEEDAAAAWRFLYAVAAAAPAPPAGLRAAAQQALTAGAVRATRWRVAAGAATPTVAFPGI
ncbi:MAG: hypothetical protein QOH14_1319 [Pseudonocardiales bacterium]|nr:hypothetical protein [Pseudonocardiales bacterium]